MALKPPRHRVDDENPRFVSAHDSEAWLDRLDSELQEAERSEDLDIDDHPHRIYARGQTRYDVTAPMKWRGEDVTILDYVDRDKATWWLLGRLPPDVRVGLKRRFSENYESACLECVRWGLRGIENGPEYRQTRDGRVHDDTIAQIIDAGDEELIQDIGCAVFIYNLGLSEPEKKA